MFTVVTFVLTCSERENISQMEHDGRDTERIERALKNTRDIYDNSVCIKIDTTEITPAQTAAKLFNMLNIDDAPF